MNASAAGWAGFAAILAQVGLGGALGAVSRFLLVRAAAPIGQAAGVPLGVTAANIIGGFAVGALAVALARHGLLDRWSPFLITGFLGGFTTFSAFSLDAVALFEQGRAAAAFAYIALNVVGALGAAALGAAAMRGWFGS